MTGSQISAVDIATGGETISPKGSDIVAPDDLAFDDDGNILFATEVMKKRRVRALENGTSRVLRDDLPVANGITVHQ